MSLALILMIVGAVLFYRIGDHDHGAGFTTAGLSIILGLITWFGLQWNQYGYLAGQATLLAGLTWYNLRRRSRH